MMPKFDIKTVRTITTTVRIAADSLAAARKYAADYGAIEIAMDGTVIAESDVAVIKSVKAT
jgi:hypothetical protein